MEEQQSAADFVLGDAFARVLTETTQSLVCVLDGDGRILLFNDACERATGFTRDEVLGREIWDLVIPPEEAEAFREVLAFIWKTGHSSPQVGHWQTKSGGRRLIAWSNKPVAGEDGEPAYLVTSGIDLTDRARRRRGRRTGARGRPGGEARRDRPARAGAARAAPRGDARRLGGEPGARLPRPSRRSARGSWR